MNQRLIIFTRYPDPGQTKTRLIPSLGSDGAANLQRELTEHTLKTVRSFKYSHECEIEVCFTGAEREAFALWLGDDLLYTPQGDGDLGRRMKQALDKAFAGGIKPVVLIGIDCPYLQPYHLSQAFSSLEVSDLVLGPALDGGYTLIGLNAIQPRLFNDIEWGSDQVLKSTLERAAATELRVTLLPPLADIDRAEDVPRWHKARDRETQQTPPRLSVILPVLNESETIKRTLKSVFAETNVEAIVVDGGSTDDTLKNANASGATVLSSSPGRATQMNRGAMLASSERLLFLHGDTKLPNGYGDAIEELLNKDNQIVGAFRLKIEKQGIRFRIVEQLVNIRSTCFHKPYGDQAFFMTKERFKQLDGYREMSFLEDLDFIQRAIKTGPVCIIDQQVLTSPRRWQRLGVCKSVFLNQIILLGYRLGISESKLERIYRSGSLLG